MNHYGLSKDVMAKLYSIFAKHDIRKIIIYGSRAKGNYRSGSDIDLCIIDNRWDLKQLFMLENEIDDLLLPYHIDFTIYHQIDNQELLDHIKRVGIEFYPNHQ